MSEKYPKSDGCLWINDKKGNDKLPDFRGKITVTKEQVKKLIEQDKAGLEMTLSTGAWKRRSKAQSNYLFLSTEVYIPETSSNDDSASGWDNDDSNQAWGQAASAPSSAPSSADDPFADDDIPF